MPEESIGLEIPRGDASLSPSPLAENFTENLTESSTVSTEIPNTVDPLGKNIFLEEKTATPLEQTEVNKDAEEQRNVSKYIRIFIVASILTVMNIIIIGLLYSYNTYITQASKTHPDNVEYVEKYKGYLGDLTSTLGMNHEIDYVGMTVNSQGDLKNFNDIVNTHQLSYIQKRDILKEKLTALARGVANKADETEIAKKDIAKYGFLPLEIRNILQNEQAISTIQRSLNSLEVIKFSTALKVFSYMDSVINIISDSLRMTKDAVSYSLGEFTKRGENDISSYVYMCYLNPFETSTSCNTIGDFDLYYQDILNEPTFERELFKNVMKYLDIMLEQSDIPSFSILFNGFTAGSKAINFTIEVNTTRQDELKLSDAGVKNPHIFIFTSLINLLKQSLFIIGGEIDTKTINITTRSIEIGNTSYIVNTSSKQFSLPIQKSTEREIFDYIDIDSLFGNLDVKIEEGEEEEARMEEDWMLESEGEE